MFTIGIVGFMMLTYAHAVFVSPTTGNAIRLLIAVLIAGVGFANRRVRLERAKGAQPLYAKASAQDG